MSISILVILWSLTLLVAALFLWVRRKNRGLAREAPNSGQALEATTVELSPERLQGSVAALLGGGALLLFLGQSSYADAEWQRPWLLALMAMGGISFLLGGQLALTARLPTRLHAAAGRLASFFQISAAQLILLGFAPALALTAGLAAGEKLLARHPAAATAAWLAGILFAVWGSRRREAQSRLDFDRWTFLGLAFLFMVALALRATGSSQLPATFSGDEGSAGMVSLKYIEGEANNLFALGWFSFPSLYFALQSLGIAALGRTAEALRVTSAVAGAMAVLAVYFLARAMFDRITGILSAVYLAASHYHIHLSRIGLNNVWDSLFAAIVLAGLWHGWQSGKRAGFIVCGLALGLGLYFYASIRVLPLLLLAWAGAAFWHNRPQFRQRFPDLLLAAWLALVAFLPMLLLFGRHPDEFNAPMNRVSLVRNLAANAGSGETESPVAVMVDHIRLTALGFTQEPLRLLYEPGRPLLLPGAATLFLLGLLWSLTHFDLRYLLLILPLLGVILIGALGNDPPASQRYIAAMPAVAILVALPLAQARAWLGRLWPAGRRWLAAGGIALMLGIGLADIQFYFFDAFESYILGGGNTLVATEVAHYLRDHERPDQVVYFFGFPRMGYHSLQTIAFLVPRMNGVDIAEPLTAPPEWQLKEPTICVFLPERLWELTFVEAAYPGGRYREFVSSWGELLFAAYEIEMR